MLLVVLAARTCPELFGRGHRVSAGNPHPKNPERTA